MNLLSEPPFLLEEKIPPGGGARVLTSKVIARKRSSPVQPPGVSQEFIQRLIQTALRNDGVGIHAAQVGVFKEVFVMKWFYGAWVACVNSSWSPLGGPETFTSPEGCLSVPGRTLGVPRYRSILARWMTPDLTGVVETPLDGTLAVVFQHEHDHGLGKTIDLTGVPVRSP